MPVIAVNMNEDNEFMNDTILMSGMKIWAKKHFMIIGEIKITKNKIYFYDLSLYQNIIMWTLEASGRAFLLYFKGLAAKPLVTVVLLVSPAS